MARGDTNGRTMVQCTACGSAYAARQLDDGSFVPIGSRNGCSCGSTSFDELTDSTLLEFDEGLEDDK
ncbi:hypothetical protein [Natronolimnobius baerhuensis]|uniref:Uncharacterized protein n=1 Tax=Natronolimnobius baerhuensis TaxID=253108 RepID=A0A202EBW1_9EURY|nr:hypothetical protein [Natronolimnobius baerhuensis]OVE85480.1 hypothetical protein B2G88_01250 [Natronolimnobius baerhuensis]